MCGSKAGQGQGSLVEHFLEANQHRLGSDAGTPENDREVRESVSKISYRADASNCENNMLVGIVSLGDLAVDQRFDTEASRALSEISTPSKPEKLIK
jgi:hypothetical protein